MTKVVGFAMLADQGLFNGNNNLPFGLIMDDLSFGTIAQFATRRDRHGDFG